MTLLINYVPKQSILHADDTRSDQKVRIIMTNTPATLVPTVELPKTTKSVKPVLNAERLRELLETLKNNKNLN